MSTTACLVRRARSTATWWPACEPNDELLDRELERVIAEQRKAAPLLVKVRVRERLNRQIGVLTFEYGQVLGPAEPRRRSTKRQPDEEPPPLPAAVEGPKISAVQTMPRRRANAPGPA